ncbi:hypothetical protein Hanom_Chr09g00804221 [Helianthus anomalus]
MLNDDESTPKDKGYGWGPKCGNYWINQNFAGNFRILPECCRNLTKIRLKSRLKVTRDEI